MVQWKDHLPLANVARVQFPDSASFGLSLLFVLVLAPRGFCPGFSGFPGVSS